MSGVGNYELVSYSRIDGVGNYCKWYALRCEVIGRWPVAPGAVGRVAPGASTGVEVRKGPRWYAFLRGYKLNKSRLHLELGLLLSLELE